MAVMQRGRRQRITEAARTLSSRARTAFAKRADRRRKVHHNRRLFLENLEDRQLLAVAFLTPAKDNTLIQNDAGDTSNGAGDIFVGLNSRGSRIRRGLLSVRRRWPGSGRCHRQQCQLDHVGKQNPGR